MELVWDGKYDEPGVRRAITLPTEGVCWTRREAYEVCSDNPDGFRNRLLWGENRDALYALREDFAEAVDLIYLDPPFAVGTDFWFPVTFGEDKKPTARAVAYRDIWGTGPESYLHQMWERLVLLRDLLAETGTIYVHCDWRMSAPLRLILDEVFGVGAAASEMTPGFRAEIAWLYRESINRRTCWNRKHDTLLMYTKSASWTFHADAVLNPLSETTIKKYRHQDSEGRRYRLMGRGITGSPIRSARDIHPEWETTHPELTFRHYLKTGSLPVDYWQMDIINQAAAERVDYPTQKPEVLLERILLASSNPGDLVLDPCSGSGTTAAVAERLGRRWLACDVSPWAVHTTRKRLLGVPGRSRPFDVYDTGTSGNGAQVTLKCDRGSVSLIGYTPDLSPLAEKDREAVAARAAQSPLDFVDFWAVDFERYPSGPFRPTWWSGRRRKARVLETVAPLPTGAGAGLSVLVVDCFGRSTIFSPGDPAQK